MPAAMVLPMAAAMPNHTHRIRRSLPRLGGCPAATLEDASEVVDNESLRDFLERAIILARRENTRKKDPTVRQNLIFDDLVFYARGGMVETKQAPSLQPQLTTELVTNVAGSPVDVSVVIPCLNEANSLGICVEKAQKAFADAGLRGEVVVADNGSTDGSIDIAEKLGARVIPVAQRGYGSGLKAGMRPARWAFLVLVDPDASVVFGGVTRFC